MGWLREHAARKTTLTGNRSAGPFDEVPISEELHAHELNEWKQWRQRQDEARRGFAADAIHELLARSHVKPRRGRPSALTSYKNYKRDFLREWAQFITHSAKQRAGMNQHDLAAAFGFSEASEWRELKRGAKNACYRMTFERFVRHTRETVVPRVWNALRRGNQVLLGTRYLMSPRSSKNG